MVDPTGSIGVILWREYCEKGLWKIIRTYSSVLDTVQTGFEITLIRLKIIYGILIYIRHILYTLIRFNWRVRLIQRNFTRSRCGRAHGNRWVFNTAYNGKDKQSWYLFKIFSKNWIYCLLQQDAAIVKV